MPQCQGLTAQQLLDYLRVMAPGELQKQVRLEYALHQYRPLIEIDDRDPEYVWLMGYAEAFSEN